MTQTPNSLRIHIGIFGRTNSGKSSLLNALTNQNFSIVSDEAGTTTDPVNKTMEIKGVGPVLFTDTAGFEDKTVLSEKRLEKTVDVLNRIDIALLVFSADESDEFTDFENENAFWFSKIMESKKPYIPVITKVDKISEEKLKSVKMRIDSFAKKPSVCVSSLKKSGIENLIEKIRQIADKMPRVSFTENICKTGDLVLLVMPQDIQAPKGRLILPQVHVLRELLDKKCIVVSCTADGMQQTLNSLKIVPSLIIVDSQVFERAYSLKPKESLLTSFSVLMAVSKGNIQLFKEGAFAISKLNSSSRVLIAEACTHIPQEEDIGRVKIPRMLQNTVPNIQIDFVRGTDFPKNLNDANGQPLYDLIIHCGACMFNRPYMLHRQELAKAANIPMTNYGLAIAALKGILDKIALP